MNDLIISGLIALLIGAVGILSYNLGKKVEKNEDFEEKKKQWQKCAVCVLLLMILLLLNGCTIRLNGDFCDVYLPVFPDYENDTPETIRQIDKNNIVWNKMCW